MNLLLSKGTRQEEKRVKKEEGRRAEGERRREGRGKRRARYISMEMAALVFSALFFNGGVPITMTLSLSPIPALMVLLPV